MNKTLPQQSCHAMHDNLSSCTAGIRRCSSYQNGREQILLSQSSAHSNIASYTPNRIDPTFRGVFSCGAGCCTIELLGICGHDRVQRFRERATTDNSDGTCGLETLNNPRCPRRRNSFKVLRRKVVNTVHTVLQKLHISKQAPHLHGSQTTSPIGSKFELDGKLLPAEVGGPEPFELHSHDLVSPASYLSELPGFTEHPTIRQDLPELSDINYTSESFECQGMSVLDSPPHLSTTDEILSSQMDVESDKSYSTGSPYDIYRSPREPEESESNSVAVSPIKISEQEQESIFYPAATDNDVGFIPTTDYHSESHSDSAVPSSSATTPSIPPPPSPSIASDFAFNRYYDVTGCCTSTTLYLLEAVVSEFVEAISLGVLCLMSVPTPTAEDIIRLGMEASEHRINGFKLTSPESLAAFTIYAYSAIFLLEGPHAINFCVDASNHLLRLTTHLSHPSAEETLNTFAFDLLSTAALPLDKPGLDPTVFFSNPELPTNLRQMYLTYYPQLAYFPENHRSCMILNSGGFEYNGNRAFPSIQRRQGSRDPNLDLNDEGVLDVFCLRLKSMLSRPSTKCSLPEYQPLPNDLGSSESYESSIVTDFKDVILGPLNLGTHFQIFQPAIAHATDAISRGQIKSFESLERQLVDFAMRSIFDEPNLSYQFMSATFELCDSALMSLNAMHRATYRDVPAGLSNEEFPKESGFVVPREISPSTAFANDIRRLPRTLRSDINQRPSVTSIRKARDRRLQSFRLESGLSDARSSSSSPSTTETSPPATPVVDGVHIKCNSCPFEPTGDPRWFKGRVKRHIKYQHGAEKDKPACGECGRRFNRPDALLAHLKSRHPDTRKPISGR